MAEYTNTAQEKRIEGETYIVVRITNKKQVYYLAIPNSDTVMTLAVVCGD